MDYEPDKRSVGIRIRDIRIARDETMEDFAKRIESNKSNVSRWERGVNLPNANTLNKIAELADISVEELLYGSSEKYIRKIFSGLKNIDEEIIPFIINGLHNSNNFYPSQKEVIDEYNNFVEVINDSRNKFKNKRDLANNLIITGKYLTQLLNQSTQKSSLIKKAIDENELAIKNFELYFEESISKQSSPKKISL